jgi:hypothetical protein
LASAPIGNHAELEASGLEVVDFDRREGGYRLRLGADEIDERRELVRELIELAYRSRVG